MKLQRWQADLLLVITALLWGGTFVVVKNAVSVLAPEVIIAFRFSVAFLFLAVIFGKACRGHWRKALIPGSILGVVLGVAFWTQTAGLQYTTPSTSAFITGLNVVFVALIDALILHRLPHGRVFLGILAATGGLLILTWTGRVKFSPGDLLTLICALLFGLHIVLTSRFIHGRDPRAITVVQFAVVSVIAWAVLPLTKASFHLTHLNLLVLILLGLFPTAIAFLLQTIAQKFTPPVHTAIILSLEPVFAALSSLILGLDRLSCRLLLGGGLIFTGTILSSVEEAPRETEVQV
ncbi:MAG TPA: DMT family transporter [Bacillota bacterium]|nr:DMT family transporter [Bacillota bacterium]